MGFWCYNGCNLFENQKKSKIYLYFENLFIKDAIEVKKDTDRIEEIKALKRNWENHEAGRAAKVKKCFTLYLKRKTIII